MTVLLYKRHAEVVCQYMKKGDCILVYGKLKTRRFNDNTGTERTVTEIIGNEMLMINTAGHAQRQASSVQNLSEGIYGMS